MGGKNVVAAIVGALFGAVATILVGAFAYWNENRAQDIEMVQIGLSILNGTQVEGKEREFARKFAINLLREYGGVDIPANEATEWAKAEGGVPYADTRTSGKTPWQIHHKRLMDARCSNFLSKYRAEAYGPGFTYESFRRLIDDSVPETESCRKLMNEAINVYPFASE